MITTPPPPEEIAGLIAQLREWNLSGSAAHLVTTLEEALHALAQENERLHSQLDTVSETYNDVAREGNHRGKRIKELESERTTAIADALVANMRAIELEAENERLKNPTPYRTELRRNQVLDEHIHELESENERLKTEFAVAVKWSEQDATDYNELRDERDAILAKTIELREAINDFMRKQDAWSVARSKGTETIEDGFELEAAYQRLKAIRALTQTDEAKTI